MKKSESNDADTRFQESVRHEIWKALSKFYLDTELDQDDYVSIADILKESGMSIEELKNIDLYEVFPALQVNLLTVAGEWAYFDSDWLNEKCRKNIGRRESALFRATVRIANSIYFWMRKRHWVEVEKRMGE